MTDTAALAALHAAAFPPAQAWTRAALDALLATPGCAALTRPGGFALLRVAADEAELLTLAVAPEARRQGTGRKLLADFDATSRARGAKTAFLEVAEDNAPALGLYLATGWSESARRPAYYARETGPAVAAICMKKPLT